MPSQRPPTAQRTAPDNGHRRRRAHLRIGYLNDSVLTRLLPHRFRGVMWSGRSQPSPGRALVGPRGRSTPTGAGVSHPLCPVRPPATHRPRPDAPTRAHRTALAKQAASPSPRPALVTRTAPRSSRPPHPDAARRLPPAAPARPARGPRPRWAGPGRAVRTVGAVGTGCRRGGRVCCRAGHVYGVDGAFRPRDRADGAVRRNGSTARRGGGTSGRALVRTARRFCGRPRRRCGRPDNLVRRANAPGPGQLKPSASATPPDGPPHKARGPTMRPVPAATLTYPSWSGTCPRFTDIRRTHHTQERFADGHSESAAQRFRSLQGDP